MKMKTIKLYLVTPDPYAPSENYFAISDPNEGIDYSRRIAGSGFAIPFLVEVTDSHKRGENPYGEEYYFDEEVAMTFEFAHDRVRSRPASMSAKAATQGKCLAFHKFVRLTTGPLGT